MAQRTTIVLDDHIREAAKELASAYGCTMSEAIRRAIVQQRDHTLGVSEERRRERREVLEKLFALSRGADPEAEVARIKTEDAHG